MTDLAQQFILCNNLEQATENFLKLVINLQPTTENIPNIHVM
jgi:hypothetical protein